MRQQKLISQIMILDFRSALVFILIAFYIIFSKLVDILSYYSILTLIEDMRLFYKY